MVKVKTLFVCSSCGYESQKWYGKCPECSNWNTFQEVSVNESPQNPFVSTINVSPQKLSEIKSLDNARISTTFEEFDRVLGGGIVPGSVVLLAGDPGVGKSTLLLQLALKLSGVKEKNQTLYVTGEESESQVKMRATRIIKDKKTNENPLILSTTSVEAAKEAIEKEKPTIVIIDSIQTIGSLSIPGFPGSVPQIRFATALLVSIAKSRGIPIFIVGHVTKEGMVAGPMVLSHMVDTVLYLEGEEGASTRVLRAFKNRFGDSSEVGIFVMEEGGMVEVTNTENFFMDKRNVKAPGSALTVVMEGSRPLLVEVQALVVSSNLSFPRRVANGIADRRLELLIAVIQKTAKIPVERMDVFVNIVGGLKIRETASDLAVCAAVISSFYGKPLRAPVAIGEVGLLGEVKRVPRLEKRIQEAKKFGYRGILSQDTLQYVSQIQGK